MSYSQTWRGFQKRCLFDAFLFLSAAIIINLIWFKYDLGFRTVAWHPYLLIIVLIGLFYGLREAIAAVILSNLAYAWLAAKAGIPYSALFASPDRTHLISFLVAGVLFGEVGELYRRYTLRLKSELAQTREQLELALFSKKTLEESNTDLRETIRFGETHLAELHRLLPPLLSKDKPQIFESTLELVEKITGAQAAALYLYDQASGTYWRHSARGQNGLSPISVPVNTPPFPELQLRQGVLSIKDLVDSGTPTVIQFMLAAPLKANGTFRGAVFIEALPLSRLNSQTEKNFQYLMDIINNLLDSIENRHKSLSKEPTIKPAAMADLVQDQIDLSKRLHSKLGVLNFKIENFDAYAKDLSPQILDSVVSRVAHIAEKNKRKFDTLTYQGQGNFTLLMHHPSSINVHPYIDRTLEEAKNISIPTQTPETLRLSFVDLGEPAPVENLATQPSGRGKLNIQIQDNPN